MRSETAVTQSPPPTLPRITVLCVDDHQIVREGLRMVINSEPEGARVVVSGQSTNLTAVTVQDGAGKPERSPAGDRILALLNDQLR